MIMSILNLIMERGAKIWTIKDNYRLDGLEFQVRTMHKWGMSMNHIEKFIGVSRNSVNRVLE